MPINNLAITKRRMLELEHILYHRGFDIRPYSLECCNQFRFEIGQLDIELGKQLEEAGFSIMDISIVGNRFSIAVLSETPEKRDCKRTTGI